MFKLSRIPVLLVGFLSALVFFGCTTTEPPRYEATTRAVTDAKYNIQARVITAEELKRQSGRVKSPFISTPKAFEPRELVVLEFVIKNKTGKAASFSLNDLEMKIGAGNYYTKNTFQLKQFWEGDDSIKSAERFRMEKIIDRYVLPRDVSIPANGLKRGYAVFFANLPKYGEMKVYLPLMSEGFKPDIYTFTFPFTRIQGAQ